MCDGLGEEGPQLVSPLVKLCRDGLWQRAADSVFGEGGGPVVSPRRHITTTTPTLTSRRGHLEIHPATPTTLTTQLFIIGGLAVTITLAAPPPLRICTLSQRGHPALTIYHPSPSRSLEGRVVVGVVVKDRGVIRHAELLDATPPTHSTPSAVVDVVVAVVAMWLFDFDWRLIREIPTFDHPIHRPGE